MRLLTEAELYAIGDRLADLEKDAPFAPVMAQLLTDANTLLEQVEELQVRRAALAGGLRDLLRS